ncbi:MAG: lysozyme inhibitor LprI family protein [Gammaproteobacteria bacterium]|nr:lysozyme inhibitor LprI family protein [Gammaproteobacteria bacterium]
MAASFDCTKASSEVEVIVCEDKEVSNLDERMAALYKLVIENSDDPKQVRQSQRDWLKTIRNNCGNRRCLSSVYNQRINELSGTPASKTSALYLAPINVHDLLNPEYFHRNLALEKLKQTDKEVKEQLASELAILADRTFKPRSNPTYYAKEAFLVLREAAIESLVGLLKSQNAEARDIAIVVLSAIRTNDQGMYDKVVTALRDVVSPYIIRDTVQNYVKEGVFDERLITIILDLLKDKDRTGGRRNLDESSFIRALGDIGHDAKVAIPLLETKLVQDIPESNWKARSARRDSIDALGKIVTDESHIIEALWALVESESYNVEEALARIGQPVVPMLVDVIKDADTLPFRKTSAIRILGKTGVNSVETESILLSILEEGNSEYASTARYALKLLTKDKYKELLEQYAAKQRQRWIEQKKAQEEDRRKPKTREQIIADLPANAGYANPASFSKEFEIEVWNGKQVLITLHEGEGRPQVLTMWAEGASGFTLLDEITEEEGMIREYNVNNFKHEGNIFLHVEKLYSGTGFAHDDKVFCVNPGPTPTLKEIVFERAPAWYKSKLKANEAVYKGELNTFAGPEIDFKFYIWNKGDANCCPTAGKVTGSYKIVKNGLFCNDVRITVDKFIRSKVQ